MRLSEINLGFDGFLCIVSQLEHNRVRVSSGLTNIPPFLVQLHAPFVPEPGSLCTSAHLASPVSSFGASGMALSQHLLWIWWQRRELRYRP